MTRFEPDFAQKPTENEVDGGHRRKIPRWAILPLVQLVAMSATLYMLLAVSVAPNERLALAVIETRSNATQNVFVSANQTVHYIIDQAQTQKLNDFTIRVGVWNICANNELVKNWTCTARRFNLGSKQETESESLADFLTYRILASSSDALEGLGEATVTIPIAAGWIGIFGVCYLFLAYFSFWRPACWRPNTCRDTFLTQRAVGMVNICICFFMVLLAWIFSTIILLASWDAMQGMSVIKVDKVKQGEGAILLSVAMCLQVVTVVLQYMLYRESGLLRAMSNGVLTEKPITDEPKAVAAPTFAENLSAEKAKDKKGDRPESFVWSQLPRYSYRSSFAADDDKKASIIQDKKSVEIKRDSGEADPQRTSQIGTKRMSSTEV